MTAMEDIENTHPYEWLGADEEERVDTLQKLYGIYLARSA